MGVKEASITVAGPWDCLDFGAYQRSAGLDGARCSFSSGLRPSTEAQPGVHSRP